MPACSSAAKQVPGSSRRPASWSLVKRPVPPSGPAAPTGSTKEAHDETNIDQGRGDARHDPDKKNQQLSHGEYIWIYEFSVPDRSITLPLLTML